MSFGFRLELGEVLPLDEAVLDAGPLMVSSNACSKLERRMRLIVSKHSDVTCGGLKKT